MKLRLFVLCIPMLVGCGKKEVAPQAQPMPVTVAKPEKRETIVHRNFPATLSGKQEIEIRARIPGVLALAPEAPDFAGKRVEQGSPLFVIEPEPYEQETLAAQAALERAVAARDLAKKRFDRVERAAKTNAVSEIDLEIAAAELTEAEAAISGAKASLKATEINETYTRIHAPVTGRMSRLFVDPGNLVGSSEKTLLATIIDDSEILAYFEVPERDVIRYLAVRDQETANQVYEKDIRLTLADGSVFQHPGRIDYIENEVDPDTRTAKVRVVFPNPDGALSAGLYGLVGYPAGPDPQDPNQKEAILVPSVAVLRDLSGNYVWVVDGENIVRRRPVETGDAVEKPVSDPNQPRTLQTVILKGLDGSENVIVAGLQRAREGAKVQPVPEKE